MRFFRNNPISISIFLLLTVLLSWKSKKVATWHNNRSIIHDITSYYSYVPAVFIYRDLDFNYRYDLPPGEPVDHVWVNTRGDTVFQKMSIGLAYFYTPTFLLADWCVKNQLFLRDYGLMHHATGKPPFFGENELYNRNGFSRPYQMAMSFNTLIAGILGMFVMLLLLRRFFSDLVTAIILALLYGGTNLLYYISVAPGLSHPYSFLLLALLLLLCLHYYQKPSRLLIILIGLAAGWVVLIRPTNLILCLIPLIIGLSGNSYRTLREHLFSKPLHLILLAVCFIIPWIPQMMYWKHVLGSFLFYSYDQEGFFFNKPHVIDGLFSYRKGWYLYTPIMFIASIGLFIHTPYRRICRSTLLVLIPFVFVVFSWWCWWYGGSFGSRVMIETYPFMAFGLGAVVQWTLRSKLVIKVFATLVFTFCLMLNFNQVWQYSLAMLHWDSMSKKAYWSIFMKDKPPGNFEDLLIPPDYERAKREGE